MARAARADLFAGFAQRRPQPLTGHLEQAEAGDTANLDARPILFQGFLQTVLDSALIAVRRHVDEVDDEQAAEITQAQLTGDFVGRLEIGV